MIFSQIVRCCCWFARHHTILPMQLILRCRRGDSTWAARALVRSPAIPRILAGADDDVLRHIVEIEEFGESEPLLLAAGALAHSWLDIAESALARAACELDQASQPEATELVSLALLNVALASQRAEPVAGLAQVRRLNDLMIKLSFSERARNPNSCR